MPGNIFDCKIPRFVASGVTVAGVKTSTSITPSSKAEKSRLVFTECFLHDHVVKKQCNIKDHLDV